MDTKQALLRRILAVALFLVLSHAGFSQNPGYEDNLPNANGNIGLPPSAAREGTSEVVNLNNGSLTMFIPLLTLPQKQGANPLTIALTYNSNQVQLGTQMSDGVSAVDGDDASADNPTFYDSFDYWVVPGFTTTSGMPFNYNIPTLRASIEYAGDTFYDSGITSYSNPDYCITNFVFYDWTGAAHSFSIPYGGGGALTLCGNPNTTQRAPVPRLLQDSADQLSYRLDATDKGNPIVYGPDGTAYHFTGPWPGCNDYLTVCGYTQSIEDAYVRMPTSIVDRNGNTITLQGDTIVDTLGRTITLENGGVTYKDSNGQTQTVSLVSGIQGQPPNYTGPDVGPTLQTDSCYMTAYSGPLPSTQFHLEGQSAWSWGLPNNQLMDATLAYSATGQKITFFFDGYYHLIQVNYPSGGYHRYDYQLIPYIDNMGPVSCTWGQVEVAHRYECSASSGSCTPDQEAVTTYVTDTSWQGFDHGFLNGYMKVIASDGGSVVHNFGSSPIDTFTTLETDTQQYDASGSLLKTTHYDYQTVQGVGIIHPFPIQVTTTLNDANPVQTSIIQSTYGTDNTTAQLYDNHVNQVVEVKQYDFSGTEIKDSTMSWFTGGHIYNLPTGTFDHDLITNLQLSTTTTRDAQGNVTGTTRTGSGFSEIDTSAVLDSAGRPTQTTDGRGANTLYSYADNWADTTCAPENNPHSTANQQNAFVTLITNANNQSTSFAYNSCDGSLASSTDPNGVVTSYTYDPAGRKTSAKATYNGTLYGEVDYQYVDGPGGSTTVTKVSSPDPNVVSVTRWDGLGRTTQTAITSDESGTDFVDTTYNKMGHVQSVSNPYRTLLDSIYGITSYLYDTLGRKTYQCQPDNVQQSNVCSPSNSFIKWTYSGSSISQTDEVGLTTRSTSDAFSRLTQVIEPTDGTTVTYSYDGFNNLHTVSQVGGGSTISRSFTYDGLSRLVTANNPENGTVCYGTYTGNTCSGGYDANNNLISKTDARGVSILYAYDSLNRPTSKTYSGSTTSAQSIAANTPPSNYVYDSVPGSSTTIPFSVGRLVSESTIAIQQLGLQAWGSSTSVQSYDPMGHVTRENECPTANTCSSPYIFQYQYDLGGNLYFSDDGLGSIGLNYSYDGAGRVKAIKSSWVDATHPATLFGPPATGDQYSAVGLQSAAIGEIAGGSPIYTIAKSYDARLRILSETDTEFPSAQPSTGSITINGGDGSTQPTGICPVSGCSSTPDIGTISVVLTGSSETFTAAVQYSGEDQDTLAGEMATALNGSDASGNPQMVNAVANGPMITITSLAAGASSNYGMAVSVTNSQDYPFTASGATLTGGADAAPPSPIYSFAVDSNGYRADDELIGVTDQVMGHWNYGYDTVKRLKVAGSTSGLYGTGTLTWQYDSFGNYQGQVLSGNSPIAVTQATYRYTGNGLGNNNRLDGYTYDASGNLLSDGTNTYTYDAENRLSSANGTQYFYDAEGRRTSKATWQEIHVHGGISLEELVATDVYIHGISTQPVTRLNSYGNRASTSVYLGVREIATYDSVGVHFRFMDWSGTLRAQGSGTGVSEEACSSLPFGDNLQCTTPGGSIVGVEQSPDASGNHFTGKERDAESGLDYFGARYYAGNMGRFNSPDWAAKAEPIPYAKLNQPQSLNLYALVENNPINAVDVDGHTGSFRRFQEIEQTPFPDFANQQQAVFWAMDHGMNLADAQSFAVAQTASVAQTPAPAATAQQQNASDTGNALPTGKQLTMVQTLMGEQTNEALVGSNQYGDDQSGRKAGPPTGAVITDATLDKEANLMAGTMLNLGHIGNAKTYVGLPAGKHLTALAAKAKAGSPLSIQLHRDISAVRNATPSAYSQWRSVNQGFIRSRGDALRVAGTDFLP